MDMATHCVDLLEWLLASPVVEVFAYGDTLVPKSGVNFTVFAQICPKTGLCS
jgi:predicted dehydrogenase